LSLQNLIVRAIYVMVCSKYWFTHLKVNVLVCLDKKTSWNL